MNIYDELALVADTKENLRLSLGLSKDVPFSQYASRIPFYLKAGNVFDFVNNQYSKDQLPVDLSDISEFIRLSSATEWQDEQFVEVQNNIPRISGDGLLIEPQSTNRIYPSNKVEWLNYNPLSTTVRMDSVGQALGVPISALECVAPGLLRAATSGTYSNGLVPATISAVVKAEGGGRIYLTFFRTGINRGIYFDPATEELEVIVGSDIADYGFERLSEGFYRIWVTRVIAPSRNAAGWVHYTIGLTDADVGDRLLVTLMVSADDPTPTSPIPTHDTPATRAPDILNIPLLPYQTITGDWDEGVTYEVADNIATFAGHGYIRNITLGNYDPRI